MQLLLVRNFPPSTPLHSTRILLHRTASTISLSSHPQNPPNAHRLLTSFESVKLASRDTPPPLHFSPVLSDRERSSTAENTPVGTPRGFGANTGFSRKPEKEKGNLFAWHHKNHIFAGPTSAYGDSTLLDSELEDSTFPLFNEHLSAQEDMGTRTAPIDFAAPSTNRFSQTSNLTSALRMTTGNEARPSSAMTISNGRGADSQTGQRDSLSVADASESYNAAEPISMNASSRDRPRRESLAGSMVAGMSWGGNSVSSWIRDEYVCPCS